MSEHPVAIIGAGPAGVAMAVALNDRGIRPLLIDRAGEVGSSWRARYDRLKLNTGRQFSHLPGRRYPKGTPMFPTRDQVADHLDRHAHEDGIELRLGATVQRIDPRRPGWRLITTDGDLDVGQLIIATGYEHTPVIPEWPGQDTFTGQLIHSSEYKNPAPYQGKRVLVVGSGSSGMEIAHDLATGGATKVWLAVRTAPNIFLRQGPGGFPTDVIATALYHAPVRLADALAGFGRVFGVGNLNQYGLPVPPEGAFARGARIGSAPAIVDKEVIQAIRDRLIEIVGAVEAFESGSVSITGGAQLEPDVVICATGYRPGLESLVGHLGVLDERGLPRAAGETPVAEGLRFIGFLSRPALLGFLSKQARRTAERIGQELLAGAADVGPADVGHG